jgi:signal peptidase II
MSLRTRWSPFLLSAAVVVADRLSKMWIEAHVGEWQRIAVIPHLLQIVHTRNTGIAFGLLQSGEEKGSIVLAVFTVLVMGFIGTLLWRSAGPGSAEHWSLRLGLALVLGGAMGNLHDRLRWGSVTDFLDFHAGPHHFPVFNVADSAITVGAGLLLLSLWLPSGKARRAVGLP